jgi:hypothetical protein
MCTRLYSKALYYTFYTVIIIVGREYLRSNAQEIPSRGSCIDFKRSSEVTDLIYRVIRVSVCQKAYSANDVAVCGSCQVSE